MTPTDDAMMWLLANDLDTHAFQIMELGMDPLDVAESVNTDTLDSTVIDSVAYWEIQACEVLDDEIDWLDREGTETFV